MKFFRYPNVVWIIRLKLQTGSLQYVLIPMLRKDFLHKTAAEIIVKEIDSGCIEVQVLIPQIIICANDTKAGCLYYTGWAKKTGQFLKV